MCRNIKTWPRVSKQRHKEIADLSKVMKPAGGQRPSRVPSQCLQLGTLLLPIPFRRQEQEATTQPKWKT